MHKHTINIRQIQTYAPLKIGHNGYGRLDFSHKYKTLHSHTADMNLFALKHGSYTDVTGNPCDFCMCSQTTLSLYNSFQN